MRVAPPRCVRRREGRRSVAKARRAVIETQPFKPGRPGGVYELCVGEAWSKDYCIPFFNINKLTVRYDSAKAK